MASSSKPRKIYDVFLSFRGTDVRNNFLGHLRKDLDRKGIHTFIDDEELRKGDQISPKLMEAIEESCIAVIVFSKDYASSQWCLEELTKIMECKKQRNLHVLPVFYRVEPKEVRGGRESYGRAMTRHESNLGKNSEKVKRWKKALFDAGSLSGWHLTDGDDESEVIQSIANGISTHLARTPLHVAKHPIGIESRVAKLKSTLNLESNIDVVTVGLWGQGGIGKTTLAKALYNSIFKQFDGSCFLANVRETSEGASGLATLQERLLNDVLSPRQPVKVSNKDIGISLIKHRLGCTKVLIILDDVNDFCQLDALAGEDNWFGDGSRIIITTRNKQVLNYRKIDQDHVYKVKFFDGSEALELLRMHAFRTPQQSEIRNDLVDGVLNYAEGLPLALEVLGSLLCGQREDVWKNTLEKLSRFPDKKINDMLKISYDDLGENEKQIFLHIVCFFKGESCRYVEKVLNHCDLATAAGLEILNDRSLISTKKDKVVNVHDLIQEMGKGIVNEECPGDPSKRSRLWTYDDVNDVLRRDMVDCAVEAIVLKLPKATEIYFDHDALKKMRRLKLLILHNVHNSFRDLIYLPNDLRWIELTEYNWRPEFSSSRKGLTTSGMSNDKITRVVKQFEGLRKLKYIGLKGCNSLVSTPDISCTPNLEELHLKSCEGLVEAHESIAYHDKLQVLKFYKCNKFRDFPKVLQSKNLREFVVSNCPKFERFPDIPHKLEGLKELLLWDTSIKKFPASIENLISLEEMEIVGCRNTVSLPCTIYNLQELQRLIIRDTPVRRFPKQRISADSRMKMRLPKLKWLRLQGCGLSEVEFLEDPSCFPRLRELTLNGNNITSIPTSISELTHLISLSLEGCHQLQDIPELPPYLEQLKARDCKSLRTDGHIDITSSIDWWDRRASLAQDSRYVIELPEGKMPEWLQQVEGHFTSFMASKDLYDKFLGLIFCINPKYKNIFHNYSLRAQFEGESWFIHQSFLDRDVLRLTYVPSSEIWKVVDFGQTNGSYARFSLQLSSFHKRKCGFRILCKPLEDHLKAEIRENQLIDISLLHEVGDDLTNPEAEFSHIARILQGCPRRSNSTRKLTRLSNESSHIAGILRGT